MNLISAYLLKQVGEVDDPSTTRIVPRRRIIGKIHEAGSALVYGGDGICVYASPANEWIRIGNTKWYYNEYAEYHQEWDTLIKFVQTENDGRDIIFIRGGGTEVHTPLICGVKYNGTYTPPTRTEGGFDAPVDSVIFCELGSGTVNSVGTYVDVLYEGLNGTPTTRYNHISMNEFSMSSGYYQFIYDPGRTNWGFKEQIYPCTFVIDAPVFHDTTEAYNYLIALQTYMDSPTEENFADVESTMQYSVNP